MSLNRLEIADLKVMLGSEIYDPTVAKFFDVYISTGILNKYAQLLSGFSPMAADMMSYVQTTQVHKEKAVIPIFVAQKYGFDLNRALDASAVTEMLWGLSVVMDDYFDNDHSRNGKPAAWVKFGSDRTIALAFEVLKVSLKHVEQHIDPGTAGLCYEYVKLGIESVGWHKSLGLLAENNSILHNYTIRDSFHTFWPFDSLTDWQEHGMLNELTSIRLGMGLFNQAGQIANDLTDLLERPGIPAKLNDLREGRVTIALSTLCGMLSGENKKYLERLFGIGRELSLQERLWVLAMIEQTGLKNQISSRVADTYARSRQIMSDHMTDEGATMFAEWIDYKLKSYERR